jgi:CcmD family protein
MDNGGFVLAAYVITAVLIGTYTWRLSRRLGQARMAANGKPRGA